MDAIEVGEKQCIEKEERERDEPNTNIYFRITQLLDVILSSTDLTIHWQGPLGCLNML